ncbi:MAG: aminodeoxychorismate/anthranilate synthase component II [Sphingobacteriales bacterium]|nr:MAG: aminodeoxychorismate/anthranilate synthase component II [Sphingobacteriales bacterium]
MWILLDNRDSFTHILHHSLLLAGADDCQVVSSHEISVEGLIALNPERLIISPGPETPHQAGITMAALAHFVEKIPVLGICLGHQAIGLHFGAQLVKAPTPMHGFKSWVRPEQPHPLFEGLPHPFEVMRYHSLALEGLSGTGLIPMAYTTDDHSLQVMVHETFPCTGIQFHPESIGTPQGLQLLQNWVRWCKTVPEQRDQSTL